MIWAKAWATHNFSELMQATACFVPGPPASLHTCKTSSSHWNSTNTETTDTTTSKESSSVTVTHDEVRNQSGGNEEQSEIKNWTHEKERETHCCWHIRWQIMASFVANAAELSTWPTHVVIIRHIDNAFYWLRTHHRYFLLLLFGEVVYSLIFSFMLTLCRSDWVRAATQWIKNFVQSECVLSELKITHIAAM